MANRLDSFSAQIVSYVRTTMSDEAILELVKNKLGTDDGGVSSSPAARPGRPPRAAAAPAAPTNGRRGGRRKKAGRKAKARTAAAPRPAASKKAAAPRSTGRKKAGRRRTGGGNRDKEMDAVERLVKSSKGLSASEISSRTKIPQSRVSAHVRALKGDKRIFQGGDRRFARYAGDQKSAEQASMDARQNAAGPRRG